MKKLIILLCIAAAGLGAWLLSHYGSRTHAAPRPRSDLATGAPPAMPAQAAAPSAAPPPAAPSDSSDAAHVAWLEKLGYVPTNAPIRDRWLAERASWWGKPLDPKEFWKGRVLWCDRSATEAANSHGRGYPPIPYDDTATKQFSDVDHKPVPGPEGYTIPYVSSSREAIFWDSFNRTHPMPPERISSYQTSRVGYRKEDAVFQGCPPEALSEEAIQWARVMKFRCDYEAALALPTGQMVGMTNYVLSEAAVDARLITEPLSDEQLKTANAWKVAYLQRLRREKTDESYINTYLKAWNLSAGEVFGPTNR